MTLKRKFVLRQGLALVGIVVLGGASVWGFVDLRGQIAEALGAHDQTRSLQQILINTVHARAALSGTEAARRNVADTLREDIATLDGLVSQQMPGGAEHVCSINSRAQMRLARATLSHLKQAHLLLDSGDPKPDTLAPLVEQASDDLATLLKVHTETIHNQTALAGHRVQIATSGVMGLVAICLAIVSTLSAMQYRAILMPFLKLHSGIRGSSAADAGGCLEESGGREFSDVARAFNQMTAELDTFHRGMEEMVLTKSQELVRSERLASVGFLAAGVAHEINNPLNIISGFAELCSRQLAREGGDNDAIRETLQSLQMIRDEAFRCKEITGRLLSLVRGGTQEREPISLKHVAHEVALMTRGLRNYRDRRIVLKFNESDSLDVWANPTEMKQVMLNLTVNALEAVAGGTGEVRIEGRRSDDRVELTISDNGRGIGPEAIKHVFEPFYTAKRGAAEPGTGLGLTITHAIIQGHRGRINVESAGPGRGTCFTISLPALATARAG